MFKTHNFVLFAALFSFAAEANELQNLSSDLIKQEKAVPQIKERASAFFQFADPVNPQPTEISLLYLHGFSASPKESSPLVEGLAKSTNSNAYFPRFRGHGIAHRDALRGIKLEEWQQEVREAFRIGRRLGKKLVVVAMSMGGALAISEILQNPPEAVVLLSPNFRLNNWFSELLLYPFGLWLAKWKYGEYRQWKAQNPEHEYFWSTSYPMDTLVQVVKSAKVSREQEVERIQTPLFLAYSPQDPVSSSAEMKKIFSRWGSPRKTAFTSTNASADSHNIAGEILSGSNTPVLQKAISEFLTAEGIIPSRPSGGSDRSR